jgi:hypothetical protein
MPEAAAAARLVAVLVLRSGSAPHEPVGGPATPATFTEESCPGFADLSAFRSYSRHGGLLVESCQLDLELFTQQGLWINERVTRRHSVIIAL